MIRKILILSLLFSMTSLFGQIVVTEEDEIDQPMAVHKNERGFSISLASNGIGIGGFYRFAMGGFSYVGINTEFFVLRDDKETDIAFNTAFGPQVAKFNDINRFFTVPVNMEFKKRIFTSSIEINFRPHLIWQGGVVFGMNFPITIIVDCNIALFCLIRKLPARKIIPQLRSSLKLAVYYRRNPALQIYRLGARLHKALPFLFLYKNLVARCSPHQETIALTENPL